MTDYSSYLRPPRTAAMHVVCLYGCQATATFICKKKLHQSQHRMKCEHCMYVLSKSLVGHVVVIMHLWKYASDSTTESFSTCPSMRTCNAHQIIAAF